MPEPEMNQPDTTLATTACPLDCPDSCSLVAKVEGGRIVKLDGDHRNPVTQGFICTKVRHYPERVYGPARLLYPALRVGPRGAGAFRRATWDEALARITERIESTINTHGAEAILPVSYGGSNGALTQDTTDARLFRRLGAAFLDRTVCAAATTRAAEALYGRMPGVSYEDFPTAQLIVVWGANPSASSIHLVPLIQLAQQRGAKLVVVDPRAIPLAKQADLHLPVRPGADLPLALAALRWLFAEGRADAAFLAAHAEGTDELRRRAEPWTLEHAAEVTGVSAESIARFAELYAASSPALLRCGWGVERNRNGGSAVAAILALPAVAGKFGVRGGGYVLSNASIWNLDSEEVIGTPQPPVRVVNMNRLGRALVPEATPPIKVLFTYNCNPLVSVPDQRRLLAGLEREDLFQVVFDQVMTDTARYADVVLPATTFLEEDELTRGYGAYVLQRIRPVIERQGEARPNAEVFAELTRRLGLARPGDVESTEDVIASVLRAHGEAERHQAELAAEGLSKPRWERPVQMVDVRPSTASGKIELCPADLDAETEGGLYSFKPDPGTRRYPLALISPATNRTVSTILGELHTKEVPCELHPDDAAARGIAEGDPVRVWNELGEVWTHAKLSRDLQPGVAFLPKGIWRHNTANGLVGTALVPDTLTDFAGGACFNDARVEVERRSAS